MALVIILALRYVDKTTLARCLALTFGMIYLVYATSSCVNFFWFVFCKAHDMHPFLPPVLAEYESSLDWA